MNTKTSIYIGDGVRLEYDDRCVVFKTEHGHSQIYLGNEGAERLLLELSKRGCPQPMPTNDKLTD